MHFIFAGNGRNSYTADCFTWLKVVFTGQKVFIPLWADSLKLFFWYRNINFNAICKFQTVPYTGWKTQDMHYINKVRFVNHKKAIALKLCTNLGKTYVWQEWTAIYHMKTGEVSFGIAINNAGKREYLRFAFETDKDFQYRTSGGLNFKDFHITY